MRIYQDEAKRAIIRMQNAYLGENKIAVTLRNELSHGDLRGSNLSKVLNAPPLINQARIAMDSAYDELNKYERSMFEILATQYYDPLRTVDKLAKCYVHQMMQAKLNQYYATIKNDPEKIKEELLKHREAFLLYKQQEFLRAGIIVDGKPKTIDSKINQRRMRSHKSIKKDLKEDKKTMNGIFKKDAEFIKEVLLKEYEKKEDSSIKATEKIVKDLESEVKPTHEMSEAIINEKIESAINEKKNPNRLTDGKTGKDEYLSIRNEIEEELLENADKEFSNKNRNLQDLAILQSNTQEIDEMTKFKESLPDQFKNRLPDPKLLPPEILDVEQFDIPSYVKTPENNIFEAIARLNRGPLSPSEYEKLFPNEVFSFMDAMQIVTLDGIDTSRMKM